MNAVVIRPDDRYTALAGSGESCCFLPGVNDSAAATPADSVPRCPGFHQHDNRTDTGALLVGRGHCNKAVFALINRRTQNNGSENETLMCHQVCCPLSSNGGTAPSLALFLNSLSGPRLGLEDQEQGAVMCAVHLLCGC